MRYTRCGPGQGNQTTPVSPPVPRQFHALPKLASAFSSPTRVPATHSAATQKRPIWGAMHLHPALCRSAQSRTALQSLVWGTEVKLNARYIGSKKWGQGSGTPESHGACALCMLCTVLARIFLCARQSHILVASPPVAGLCDRRAWSVPARLAHGDEWHLRRIGVASYTAGCGDEQGSRAGRDRQRAEMTNGQDSTACRLRRNRT